jgi:hypothetical protein
MKKNRKKNPYNRFHLKKSQKKNMKLLYEDNDNKIYLKILDSFSQSLIIKNKKKVYNFGYSYYHKELELTERKYDVEEDEYYYNDIIRPDKVQEFLEYMFKTNNIYDFMNVVLSENYPDYMWYNRMFIPAKYLKLKDINQDNFWDLFPVPYNEINNLLENRDEFNDVRLDVLLVFDKKFDPLFELYEVEKLSVNPIENILYLAKKIYEQRNKLKSNNCLLNQCKDRKDILTQDDFEDARDVIFFLETSLGDENIVKDIHCFPKEIVLNFSCRNLFANWVQTRPNKEIEPMGYGGSPGNDIYMKVLINGSNVYVRIGENEEACTSLRRIKKIIRTYKIVAFLLFPTGMKLIGNIAGTFEVGGIYGQAPGYYTYDLYPLKHYELKKYLKKCTQLLKEDGIE